MTSPDSSPRVTRREPLHQQVARNIRNDIESGVLRHGEALTSTRDLAERFDVSVFTITEAMKLLADEGLIINVSRSKRVVNWPDHERPAAVRPERPQVLFIGGFAGSGKTELGRILARETGWPLLDKDTLTRPVVEAALELIGLSPNDRDSDDYFTKIRPREYEALLEATEENVQCGTSAIVTAPFIREFSDTAWVNRVKAAYASLNADPTFVWVYCDAGTMHTYVRRRGAARDANKLADWPGYLTFIDINFRPPMDHYVIDNCASSTPLQMQARELLKSLDG